MSSHKLLKVAELHIDVLEETLKDFTDSQTKAELHGELAKTNKDRADLEAYISRTSGDPDPDLPSADVVETSLEHDLHPEVEEVDNSNFSELDEEDKINW